VLSGSMVATGTQLQVIAELTEAEVGRAIWSERFRGTVVDVIEMQETLASDITKRVVPYVRQLELQRARSKGPEYLTAYERTLRAIDHFHRNSREDLSQSRALLEAALASDPSYAPAHAWLARWHVRVVGQAWSDNTTRDTIEAHRHAEAALRCDGTDPLALAVSGMVAGYLDKDLEAAIAYYDRSLAINPSLATAWAGSTVTHAWLGHGDEAVARSHRAIELSPLDPDMFVFMSFAGTAYAVAGQYDKAIAFSRDSMRLNRTFLSTHRVLVISLALSGDVREARRAAAEMLGLESGLTVGVFRNRYPGNKSPHADRFCEALAIAGVPS
jgi:adenylate cyclase